MRKREFIELIVSGFQFVFLNIMKSDILVLRLVVT